MLHKAIQQFLEDVAWGELEYLLLDLPPGTGDVSMTLAQLLPQAKFVMVRPGSRGPAGARRGAETAATSHLEIPGVIENMSGFRPRRRALHDLRGGRRPAAGRRADRAAARQDPVQEELRGSTDKGRPLVLEDLAPPAAQALFHAARGVIAATPQELGVLRPPAPSVRGTPLPMVQYGLRNLDPAAAAASSAQPAELQPFASPRLRSFGVWFPSFSGRMYW